MTVFTWTAICWVAFFLLSMCGAISDIRARKVSNKLFAFAICLWSIWRVGCIGLSVAVNDPVALEFECTRTVSLIVQALLVYAFMLLTVNLFERITSRFAMGGADLKFIAVCTAFLGFETAMLAVMLGCAVGFLYPITEKIRKTKGRGIPLVATIASVLPLTALII